MVPTIVEKVGTIFPSPSPQRARSARQEDGGRQEDGTDMQDVVEVPPGYVYVLELENNNWYVGYTTNVEKRIRKQIEGKGSAWTRLHPVIELRCVLLGDKTLERVVTLDLMRIYGIRKVRGAAYTRTEYREDWPTDIPDAHCPEVFLTPFPPSHGGDGIVAY